MWCCKIFSVSAVCNNPRMSISGNVNIPGVKIVTFFFLRGNVKFLFSKQKHKQEGSISVQSH